MDEQIFTPLDHQFARFMTRQSGLAGDEADRFALLIKRLSAAMAAGHSCLPLTSQEEPLLRGSLVSQGITTPLVLWHGRLYLQRYYRYELRLADQLKALARVQCRVPEYQTELDACFGKRPETDSETDWQRQAAEMALSRPLALISGGPGTGKTRTVARILGLLLLALGPDLRIALAAPTGKAAMRLRESISASLAALPFSASIKEKIPTTACTLHRLLGVRRNSSVFRHHHGNPLPWDVVVVDEASMVDLAMMSKLVDALKSGARLVLLGDKDQLASVESGAVLADCIQALPDNTVTLHKSYRFNHEISAFARAVNRNDSTAAWSMLTNNTQEATTTRGLQLLQGPLPDFIVARYLRYMEKVAALPGNRQEDDIRPLFQCLNRFRVLCATRHGAGGVEILNRQVEQKLAAGNYPCQPGGWYPGRPVIILNNDYGLNLFNGDIGICLPDPPSQPAASGRFKVWFEHEDGSLKGYQPYRLPECETVFAMTIHKSQGSEFTEVLVVLPASDSPLLTRELIYTAVTRARTRVLIAGDQAIFTAAVNRTISRSSGLHEMLICLE
ncbi:MAG: exodeoxyribonuclease V subunit alpha [Deltaproteobacteria bacterium]|nr:exodeoxyribonuclease V subunit alpha [Deltaproteobacteria bacterium]